jgi:hypothetical protein
LEPESRKEGKGESLCLSSCATPSSQLIFPSILLCYPALYLLLLLYPPLFFSLLPFLISSSFSVSFSSHISPLSFRLLDLFFLYIPFLALALSLVCFHASHSPLPLLSSLISFYRCFSFSSSTPLPQSSPNSNPMSYTPASFQVNPFLLLASLFFCIFAAKASCLMFFSCRCNRN